MKSRVIYELSNSEYERARPVFKALDYHLVVNSIIEGTTRAKIYVDDPADPGAAITWTKHRFYLAGDADNDAFNRALSQLFVGEIYPQSIKAGKDVLILYYSPGSWEEEMNVILKDRFPTKHQRQFLVCKELRHDWKALIPAGFSMRRVDKELLANTGLKHLGELVEELESERSSVEDFLSKSFSFCLVRGEEIVGWCLSEYNSENQCEVGIETVKGYRRQGVATLTACALVEHALSNNITRIGWHCWANNKDSIALAKKVGFEHVTDYPVYYVRFNEAAEQRSWSAPRGESACS